MPDGAYMHQWTWSSLVQVMACRHQAITWNKNDLLSIAPSETNFSEMAFEIFQKLVALLSVNFNG